MAKRHPNTRLVKINRNYAVDEIAQLFSIHRNTVDRWIKREGLSLVDSRRPRLVRGPDLIEFLDARRMKNKRKCRPGEIYCLRCRVPRKPAGTMAEYQAQTALLGNLVGICPVCDGLIYRRVNIEKLRLVQGDLEVSGTEGQGHIGERELPSLNSGFNPDERSDA